jgi:citrate lyase beta subunit
MVALSAHGSVLNSEASASPVSPRVAAARVRLVAAGIDPAAVPHAGAETVEGFQRECEELMAAGLEGEALLQVLAGPTVADPPELTALLEGRACAPTS